MFSFVYILEKNIYCTHPLLLGLLTITVNLKIELNTKQNRFMSCLYLLYVVAGKAVTSFANEIDAE